MLLGGTASDTTAASSRPAPQHTAAAAGATSGSTTEDLGLHSAQVLHAYWVKCHDLRAAIRGRNHQGRPGPYRGDDTARVRVIEGWVMPSLLRGKLPREHDGRMLFLGPKATLATAAQVELAAWARDVNNRSASSAEELAIPAYPQQTLRYVLTKMACVPRGLGDVGGVHPLCGGRRGIGRRGIGTS
jgi:hypothetical protein